MTGYRQKGFTLMEIVVVLIVLGLMTSFAVPYMSNGVRAYNDTAAALQTVSQLRYASERIARELREVQRNIAGNFDITTPVTGPNNTITFRKSDGEQVTIGDAAPILSLAYDTSFPGATFTLSDELTSITFNYYQSDNTQATGANNVAYIEFELVLNNGNTYNQRTRVALRNRP